MSDRTYLQHGRRHGPGGSDEIPGLTDVIRYNYENTGGWVSIVVTDQGGGGLGDEAFIVHDTSGEGIELFTTGGIRLEGEASAALISDAGVQIGAGADVEVQMGVGDTVRIRDSGGSPIFEVRDDGTVHILTGGTIVADL